jgi:hypothetical protein
VGGSWSGRKATTAAGRMADRHLVQQQRVSCGAAGAASMCRASMQGPTSAPAASQAHPMRHRQALPLPLPAAKAGVLLALHPGAPPPLPSGSATNGKVHAWRRSSCASWTAQRLRTSCHAHPGTYSTVAGQGVVVRAALVRSAKLWQGLWRWCHWCSTTYGACGAVFMGGLPAVAWVCT